MKTNDSTVKSINKMIEETSVREIVRELKEKQTKDIKIKINQYQIRSYIIDISTNIKKL